MRPSQKLFIEAIFSGDDLVEENFTPISPSDLILSLKQIQSEIQQTTYVLVSSCGVISPDLKDNDLLEAIRKLNLEFPNWSLAASSGEIASIVGGTGSTVVDYLSGPGHKFPTTNESFIADVVYLERGLFRLEPMNSEFSSPDSIRPSDSVEVMLSNLQNLRRGSLVISAFLAAWTPNKSEVRSHSLQIRNSKLINAPHPSRDLEQAPIRLAIITRTRWTRTDEIHRNITSIREASKQNSSKLQIEHVIVSDHQPKLVKIPDDVSFKLAHDFEAEDSRFFLVDFAVKNVGADFYWFIDDDDFAKPEAISLVGHAILSRAGHGLVLVGSEQLIEHNFFNKLPASVRGHSYSPRNFLSSFSETNQIPFCSIVFPGQSLKSLDRGALEKLQHLEDHYLLLKAMSDTKHVPLLIDQPLVKISIRRLSARQRKSRRDVRQKSHTNLVWLWATSSQLANQGFLAAGLETGKKAAAITTFLRTCGYLLNPRTWLILWGNGIFAEFLESNSPAAQLRNWLSRLRSK